MQTRDVCAIHSQMYCIHSPPVWIVLLKPVTMLPQLLEVELASGEAQLGMWKMNLWTMDQI